EVSKIRGELAQWDTKLESKFKKFKDEFKGELRFKLYSLFGQYLGHPNPTPNNVEAKGGWSKLEQLFEVKGILNDAKVHTVMLHLDGRVLD
ncbi:hypothetical protein J1N35_040176, partial [Gossypium stocksii]